MENLENQITVIEEDGSETLCEVLFTYHSEKFNKNYVLCYPIDEAEDENGEINVLAYSYDENQEEENGSLLPIETEAEWDEVEEMFNTFYENEEADEDEE